jgi:DNA-binding PadR family transcriptional regulator
MPLEINSSLDLFLLGLIQSGVNTPYLFRERARLSVGATLPALERLEKNRFISRSEKGMRNKQEFELTDSGKRALNSALSRMLEEYQLRPPSDNESIFRVASLALAAGKATDAVAVLNAGSTARAEAPAVNSRQISDSADLPSTYTAFLAACDSARKKAEARVIFNLASSLSRRRADRTRPAAKKRKS